MSLTIRAHAKLNLDLRIVGVRPDGFHELRTIFQSIALADTLTVARRPGPFALRCRAPRVPLDASNLIWRAADLLWRALRRAGEVRDVAVTLEKRIPLQAGLGGGSSDAAAALVALSRLWGFEFDASQLHDLAARLGADVPFFLHGGRALGRGHGDDLSRLPDLRRQWVVVAHPAFGVSTTDAYAWYDADREAGRLPATDRQRLADSAPEVVAMVNDLEGPVARRLPAIAAIKAALVASGASAAAMSGSGSALFGLFRARAAAQDARRALARRGWRALLTYTLGREEYVRRARPVRRSRSS